MAEARSALKSGSISTFGTALMLWALTGICTCGEEFSSSGDHDGNLAGKHHLHLQFLAIQHHSVLGVHGNLGMALVRELDEGKTTDSYEVVLQDIHIAHAPILAKGLSRGID